MNNVTFLEIDGKEHAVIENADGSKTSMLKTTYDEKQAEQSTPIVIDEAETK